MKFNTSKILNLLLACCLLLLLLQQAVKSKNETMNNSTNNTLEIIHQRKSVRSYTTQQVTKSQIETLVKAGMAAPTAVNKQPWAFIAIDDRTTLNQLGDALPYAKMLKNASAAIVVCGDMSKSLKDWEQQFWIQDCSAASQNILLAAESMGLGAVWTAAYPDRDRMNAVINILNLPEHIIPLNVIPIGYPTGVEKPKDKWKSDNMHWQQWGGK